MSQDNEFDIIKIEKEILNNIYEYLTQKWKEKIKDPEGNLNGYKYQQLIQSAYQQSLMFMKAVGERFPETLEDLDNEDLRRIGLPIVNDGSIVQGPPAWMKLQHLIQDLNKFTPKDIDYLPTLEMIIEEAIKAREEKLKFQLPISNSIPDEDAIPKEAFSSY